MRILIIPFVMLFVASSWFKYTEKKSKISVSKIDRKAQVPVLCYHNIHERKPNNNPVLTINESEFKAQMRSLYDSGYHTISPNELCAYLTSDTTLPAKPIMLTFDDAHTEDYFVVKPVLEYYNFKAVFFINTVCLNKKKYLTKDQIRELAQSGHVIAAHTWDHPDLISAKNINWKKQLYFPKKQLEQIVGQPVNYFAYPYGSWNKKVIDSLKHYGYEGAFQLTGKPSKDAPEFTIRRIMVSGNWSGTTLQNFIRKEFY